MSILLESDIGYTGASIEFYEKYKEAFGEVIKAEMVAKPVNVKYALTLTNNLGEKLVFNGGLTSGYSGEGCRGTRRVLEMAGFKISDEFIQNNTSFILTK